jgi:hypothetical protein
LIHAVLRADTWFRTGVDRGNSTQTLVRVELDLAVVREDGLGGLQFLSDLPSLDSSRSWV